MTTADYGAVNAAEDAPAAPTGTSVQDQSPATDVEADAGSRGKRQPTVIDGLYEFNARLQQDARAARSALSEQGAKLLAADDGPKDPDWYFNGTITGLLVDVGSAGGYYMFLLLTMFFGLAGNRDELLHCGFGTGEADFRRFWQACLCEYTKAHLLVFPTIAVAVVMMYMGRDLLCKRLYYGLLRNGGVIDFSENKAFKDPLVLVIIVNYLHVVAHLSLMYWLLNLRQDPQDPQPHDTGLFRHTFEAPSRASKGAMGYLWGAVMIPGTLVIVFAYLGYDIETYLVPLSQYVHGLPRDKDAMEKLCSLHVFRDACVKIAVEDQEGPVATASGSDLDTQYTEVVAAARKVIEETDAQEVQASIGLLQSLWPTELLLRSNTPDVDAQYFRYLWVALAASGISFMIFALCSMVPGLLKDVKKLTSTNHQQAFAQVPVLLMSIVVVCLCTHSYVHTFKAFTPAKRRSCYAVLDAFSKGGSTESTPLVGGAGGVQK